MSLIGQAGNNHLLGAAMATVMQQGTGCESFVYARCSICAESTGDREREDPDRSRNKNRKKQARKQQVWEGAKVKVVESLWIYTKWQRQSERARTGPAGEGVCPIWLRRQEPGLTVLDFLAGQRPGERCRENRAS